MTQEGCIWWLVVIFGISMWLLIMSVVHNAYLNVMARRAAQRKQMGRAFGVRENKKGDKRV